MVWDVLADLGSYREWNPYIVDAAGILRPGEHLKLMISAPDSDAFPIETVVDVVTSPGNLVLSWRSDDAALFSGAVHFQIEETPGGARLAFIQTVEGDVDMYRGLGDRNDLALEMMLTALKARSERKP